MRLAATSAWCDHSVPVHAPLLLFSSLLLRFCKVRRDASAPVFSVHPSSPSLLPLSSLPDLSCLPGCCTSPGAACTLQLLLGFACCCKPCHLLAPSYPSMLTLCAATHTVACCLAVPPRGRLAHLLVQTTRTFVLLQQRVGGCGVEARGGSSAGSRPHLPGP